MSSILTGILSSTVGLLWNKARDSTAAKLKDGDVTDTKIREIVVRELNDMRTKLDGLSRKDLLSSYSFLEEGVALINVSLTKSKLEQKALASEAQDDRGTSGMSSGVHSGILYEALELSDAMKMLKINSDKEFESALERFKDARKRATDSFHIDSLSIQDRILAAKLRIVSEMLECLERPEIAITGCLLFLKKLHSLPAIQEIFDVYLNRGVRSMLNKAERVENVKSVMLINFVLFQYSSKFSRRYPFVLIWPTIELADRSFRPILDWLEVSTRTSMGDELSQLFNGVKLDEGIDPEYSAVNGYGDVVVREHSDNVKVISKTNGNKGVTLPKLREGRVIKQARIVGLAIDKNNNIYVVRWLELRARTSSQQSLYVMNILDENYYVKHECTLDFLLAIRNPYKVAIAIDKNNNIIMMQQHEYAVYVCDHVGELKYKFTHGSGWQPSLSISEESEIISSSIDRLTVHKFSEEGKLKSTIKLPEGHKILGLAFHHVICKIIVLTFVEKEDSYFLLCFTEAGEMESSTFFYKNSGNEWAPDIRSHPSGPVAVVREKSITFI